VPAPRRRATVSQPSVSKPKTPAAPLRAPFEIGGATVAPGTAATISLPVGRLYTQSQIEMVVRVVHGRRPGPVLFVSAAVHGDELNGVEIIRRLLRLQQLRRLRGTLVAVPVVNGFGLIDHSRYLPDRRDLNRSFPGSERGSLAARLARLFMTEVAARSTHGIDLHTGALHRSNLPQVRVHLGDDDAVALARAFGAPVVVNAPLRDGSLREAAGAGNGRAVPVIVYEAGEALRFDEWAIKTGMRGVIAVMHHLGMLAPSVRPTRPVLEPLVSQRSFWVRASEAGILRTRVRLGDRVREGRLLGQVGDPLGETQVDVRAPGEGLVIGATNLPLVHEGDALYHLATLEHGGAEVASTLEAYESELEGPLFFDPESGTT